MLAAIMAAIVVAPAYFIYRSLRTRKIRFFWSADRDESPARYWLIFAFLSALLFFGAVGWWLAATGQWRGPPPGAGLALGLVGLILAVVYRGRVARQVERKPAQRRRLKTLAMGTGLSFAFTVAAFAALFLGGPDASYGVALVYAAAGGTVVLAVFAGLLVASWLT